MPYVADTRWAVPSLLVCAGLPVLAGTMLTVALPAVAEGLHASPVGAAAVVAVYFAAQALLQPFAGRLSDLAGAGVALRSGLVVLAIGSAAAACSPSLCVLLAARVVQAGGVALVLPAAHAALAGQGRDGSRFGWLVGTGNVTAAVGPLLGGVLVAATGWRGAFALTTVLAACCAAALLSPPPATLDHRRDRLHDVLRDRRILRAATLNGLDNFVLQLVLVGVPFAVLASGRLDAARAVALLTLAGALAAPAGGWLADRVGRAAAARAGFLVAASGLVALHALPDLPVAALALVGAGLGLEVPAVQAAPLALAPRRSRAAAAGVAASARHFGSLLGAGVAGLAAAGPAPVFAVGAVAATAAAIMADGLQPPSA